MDAISVSDELNKVVALLKSISSSTDPQEMVRQYAAQRSKLVQIDRTLSLSRRNLAAPFYRITRSDLWQVEINPWTQKDQLPLLSGGLLGELLYAGEPRMIDVLETDRGDPAAKYFAGMGSLMALPHFDGGVALNMVIHMRKENHAFNHAQFPEIVALSGMFGQATRALVMAKELADAKAQLQAQYLSVTSLADTVLEQTKVIKAHADTLEDRVRQRTDELEAAHMDAIYMLAIASEEKDQDTASHLRRMESLTAKISRSLGHREAQTLDISRAGILHDVGKLHVPDDILKKPGPLTAQERAIMQEHTLAGERILSDKPWFQTARRVARSHHENWDGSGYPDRLSAWDIPLEARIVHLADVYDALISRRPYKLPWEPVVARDFVRQQRGAMFDPELVDIFLSGDSQVSNSKTATIS
jgi:HD-GYP domain-containing protein (c-di-GMP phosphodiesterase class II)